MTIEAHRALVELLTDTGGHSATRTRPAALARPPTRPARRHSRAAALTLATVLTAACGRPPAHTPDTTTPPTAAPPAAGTETGPSAPTAGRDGGAASASSTGGLFGALPTAATTTTAPTASAAAGSPGRSDPVAVARAYATGLFTVDWIKPTPTAQKVAATRPWATPAATAKLAHGQYYQPGPTDPRVATHEVDTVDHVDVAAADPAPGANSYAATVHLTVRSDVGVTANQATVLLSLVHQTGGWLVDDTHLVE